MLPKRIVELPRLGKPILSRRRIDHEDDRDGEHRAPARDVHDLGKLPHEIRARVKAPCRVDEDEIGALSLGALTHIIADAQLAWECFSRQDCIRFGTFQNARYLKPDTKGKEHLKIFPIPQTALDANRNLKQNPNY